MLAPLAGLVLVLSAAAVAAARKLRRSRLPGRAIIISPRRSTVMAEDGAVRSVQTAELSMPPDRLEPLWSPANLENLARTYWAFLSRVTLGLIRVVYGENERSVVLFFRPLTLLRFDAPEYEMDSSHGSVRWRIRDGLLVTRHGRGRGLLSVEVRRDDTGPSDPAKLRIEVEVANFYPAIAASFSTPVYMATQAFVHVLVTHAFLRSLATLELAESKVGRLAEPALTAAAPPDTDAQP